MAKREQVEKAKGCFGSTMSYSERVAQRERLKKREQDRQKREARNARRRAEYAKKKQSQHEDSAS